MSGLDLTCGGVFKPLALDLFCGLGGWSEGLLAEGWRVVGIDIWEHVYGEQRYPAGLIIQDALTVDGRAFSGVDLIVASPPCQFFSYTAMPWSRAKALAAKVRADPALLEKESALFRACFRIQSEASAAAGRHIPLIVENVRGAVPWVGRSRWNFGSYHLWGDVPALMPTAFRLAKQDRQMFRDGHNVILPQVVHRDPDGHKLAGFRFDGSGRSFQSASVEHTGVKAPGVNWSDRTKGPEQDFTRIAGEHVLSGQKGVGPKWDAEKGCGAHGMARWTNPAEGLRGSGDWFGSGENCSEQRRHGSKSNSRQRASAMIAKIPEPLARHIARVFHPDGFGAKGAAA